jgi:hypothetical protein
MIESAAALHETNTARSASQPSISGTRWTEKSGGKAPLPWRRCVDRFPLQALSVVAGFGDVICKL